MSLFKYARRKAGAVMIEFGLVLPLLILVILGTLEATHYVAIKNRVISVSRDVAIEVFKRCETKGSGAATQSCLDTEADTYYTKISDTLAFPHHIQVQLFRASNPFNSTAPCPLDAAHSMQSTAPLSAPLVSKVSVAPGSPLAVLCAANGVLDAAQESMVVVETNYKYLPMISFFANLLGYTAGNAYVASVV